MFADAIDIPFVLGLGIAVLVPLLLFQILVESFILRQAWALPFRDLCRFTFIANCLSLAAGIPTKILNAWLYDFMLPDDLAGFFASYPRAVSIGTLIYFAVTLAVEGALALRWLQVNRHPLSPVRIWKGIVLANLASYAVLAPLHYYITRPISQISKITLNAQSTGHSDARVLFTDFGSGQLRAVRLDGTSPETIVPIVVKDYLVSADFNLCLFRGADGNLHLFHRANGQSDLVWQTKERFNMNQVAFSPSGQHVAIASEQLKHLEVVEINTGKRTRQPLPEIISATSVIWSTDEMKFFIRSLEGKSSAIATIQSGMNLSMEPWAQTNSPALLSCYGRVGDGVQYRSDDWSAFNGSDVCGDLHVWTELGLGSGLRIYRQEGDRVPVLSLSVNPGLLHLARFHFKDPTFMDGCEECLFQANDYIYLLNVKEKKVGTVAHGTRFITLSARFQKHL